MENGPFIDDFPIEPSIYRGFSMAMLTNQMVTHDKTMPLGPGLTQVRRIPETPSSSPGLHQDRYSLQVWKQSILSSSHAETLTGPATFRQYGGFLKWGYPQIIHTLVGFSIRNCACWDIPEGPISEKYRGTKTKRDPNWWQAIPTCC